MATASPEHSQHPSHPYTQFEEAREACAVKDNLWSCMRAAETDLWILFSDENQENHERATFMMRETLEMAQYYTAESQPTFFSWGTHELGDMRPIIAAHAASITAFATLGLAMLEFRAKSYVQGGYHLRSSWKTFEAARALQGAKEAGAILRGHSKGVFASFFLQPIPRIPGRRTQC